jgi:hypothetical protein
MFNKLYMYILLSQQKQANVLCDLKLTITAPLQFTIEYLPMEMVCLQ